jgi:hypothetical protein
MVLYSQFSMGFSLRGERLVKHEQQGEKKLEKFNAK